MADHGNEIKKNGSFKSADHGNPLTLDVTHEQIGEQVGGHETSRHDKRSQVVRFEQDVLGVGGVGAQKQDVVRVGGVGPQEHKHKHRRNDTTTTSTTTTAPTTTTTAVDAAVPATGR